MRHLVLLLTFLSLHGLIYAQQDSLKTGVNLISVSGKDSLRPINESLKKQLTGLQKQEALQKKNLRLILNLKNQKDGLLSCRWLAVGQKKDILHVNLSVFISKYIGETEKNLEQLFSIASKSNLMLFFDEADALFGKRTASSETDKQELEKTTNILITLIEKHKSSIILSCKADGCPYLPVRLKFIRISG